MAPHSSTPAWRIPWTEEPGRLQSMGLLRVGHDWVTSLSLFTFMHWCSINMGGFWIIFTFIYLLDPHFYDREGNGTPLQYSCLENPMDGGAWDFPGKSTGVGCHFLLQCVKVTVKSCPTLSNPMDCSLPGSSVHGIFQARVLEWVASAGNANHNRIISYPLEWS